MYGGTVLSATVWASFHERQAEHLPIIEALLEAGGCGGISDGKFAD